jgi:hypothetical protein
MALSRTQSERLPAMSGQTGVASADDDDYHIEGERDDRPTVGARIVHALQILLIIFVAILSLAIFWLLGVIFHIF